MTGLVLVAFETALETDVGPDDDFFGLGGDSLAAMVALTEIGERLGVELDPAAVFAYPTAAGLAEAVRLGLVVSAGAGAGPVRNAVAAAPVQEAHLLLAPHISSRGFLSWVLQLNGRLDAAALAGAVDDVVRRYEVLRARFEPHGDGFRQVVAPFAPDVLGLVDTGAPDKLAGIETALAAVDAELGRLSAVDRPGLQGTLYRVDDRTSVLALFVAEAVVDSESGPLLAAELSRAYAARAGLPEPPGLPAVSAGCYVEWAAAHPVPADAARRAHDHWAALPADPYLAFDGPGGASGFSLDADEWAGVLATARTLRTTPYVVVLAGYALALARALGRPPTAVDSVVTDRGGAAAANMIGSFQSVVRVATDVDPDAPFAAAAARVATALRDAVGHCAVPSLVADARAGRLTPAGAPLLGPSLYMFDSRTMPVFGPLRRRRFRPRAAGREPLRLNSVAGPDGRQVFTLTSATAPEPRLAAVTDALRDVLLAR